MHCYLYTQYEDSHVAGINLRNTRLSLTEKPDRMPGSCVAGLVRLGIYVNQIRENALPCNRYAVISKT